MANYNNAAYIEEAIKSVIYQTYSNWDLLLFLHTNKRKFYQIPVIGAYLLKRKGKKEKEEWISICKDIVKDQI